MQEVLVSFVFVNVLLSDTILFTIGSFHTIHLFLDDYALYLVEETIAQANYILMRQQQVIQQAESSSTATTSTSVTRTNIYSSPSSSTSKGNLS